MNNRLTVFQPGGGYPHPHLWVEPRSMLNIRFAAFEGLVKYDAAMNIVPGLAESWDVSDDAREWIFTLRKNVLFHDGTLMKASDAAASIRNASGKDVKGAFGTSSLLYAYLGDAEVQAADQWHVVIRLLKPMADLLDLLVYIMIVPEHSISGDAENIPGTGPYCFAGSDGNKYIFRRNPDYWDTGSRIEELIFVIEKDPSRRIEALQSGEADIITDIKGPLLPQNESLDKYHIAKYETPVALCILLNCFEGPFTDVRVRQAVNFGTDVEQIIGKAAGGFAKRLTGPLTPYHFGYDHQAKAYPYDPEKAVALLNEAGYKDGLDITMYRPVIMPDESGLIAECVKEQWEKIGIHLTEIIEDDREQYALNVRDKKIHDLCIFDSAPLSTYRVLHEKLDSGYHGPWWEGYDSQQFNALMEKAASAVSIEKRRTIYGQAIKTAADDAPWVFLYSPTLFFGAKPDVAEQFPGIFSRADGVILLR